MPRRRAWIAVAALALIVGAIVWWGNRGGAGAKGDDAAAVGAAEDAARPPQARVPKPLETAPIDQAAASVPPPKARGRASRDGVGSGNLSVVGRAVDEAGKPVAKPTVEVVVPDGTFADSVGDDDGTFTVSVFLLDGRGPLHAFVEARASDGRLARKELVIRSDHRFAPSAWRQKEEVGDLVLRAPIAVDVLVVSPSGSPVAADVYALVAETRWAVARAVVSTGKDGRGRLVGLTAEPHRLVATAGGFGRGVATVTPGSGDGTPVRVVLAVERPIDVLVVEDATKKPVSRAQVEVLGLADESVPTGFSPLVPPLADLTTDETGHARLLGMGAGDDVALVARDETAAQRLANPYGPRDGAWGATLAVRGRSFVVVPQGETAVTLAISTTRTIEWPIEAGEVPIPADGTTIGLTNPAGSGRPSSEVPTQGRVEHGRLVVDGCQSRGIYAEAHAPDGAIAQIQASAEQAVGYPIKFQRSRRVEVILKNADGSPAAGLRVQFRQEGNNPVGGTLETDADGRAVLEGQQGWFRTAWLATEGEEWSATALGSADIRAGDGRIEATIPAPREAIVRVKADAPIDLDQATARVAGPPATILSRDASKGELRIRWRPSVGDAPGVSSSYGVHVAVWAPGFLEADAKIPDGELPVVEIELHAAAYVSVALSPPARGSLIMLQRFDEKTRRWRTVAENNVGGMYAFEIGGDGRGTAGPIEPGRYRWVDARSGTLSLPFDVGPGADVERTLDLSKTAIVRGRVEVPAGESPRGIGILRVGADPDIPGWQMNSGQKTGSFADANGKFEIRVPGDQSVRLTIERGVLVPASDGGEVEVTGARDDVVLRAVRGASAVLRFDKELRSDSGAMRVLLFRGETVGEPEFQASAKLDGTRIQFFGFTPGRYTLWIDSAPFAPTILRGIDLRDGENDLGKTTVSEGTTVVLKILTKPGMRVPLLQFFAGAFGEPDGPPNYSRTGMTAGNEARLKGLGAGRVHVSTFAQGVPRGINKTLDVDGTGEVVLELDLR